MGGSSCSTCINTETQCGQPPHTAGDTGRHCVGKMKKKLLSDRSLERKANVPSASKRPHIVIKLTVDNRDRNSKTTHHPWFSGVYNNAWSPGGLTIT
ncbi:Hypothetical predicted protein, partial [Xyrichtys novacula]